MATIFETLATEAGALIIKDNGASYKLTSAGLERLAAVGEVLKPLNALEGELVMNRALQAIEAAPQTLSSEVKNLLPTLIDKFGSAEPARFSRVKQLVQAAADIEISRAPAAEAILRANPTLKGYLTETGTKHLETLGVDLVALEKTMADALAKTKVIEGLGKELETLLTKKGVAAAEVEQFLVKNSEHLAELKPSDAAQEAFRKSTKGMFNKGFSFSAMKSGVADNVSALTAKAETLVGELVKQKKIIAINPGADAVEAAAKEVTRLEKELKGITGGTYGKAIKVSEGALGKLHLLDSGLAKSLGHTLEEGAAVAADAAKKGAKWIAGGKWHGFKHTAETVGHEVGKIGKFRWGKAGIVGGVAAAGTYAVSHLVGTGSKGKHTEQVMADQGVQRSASLA